MYYGVMFDLLIIVKVLGGGFLVGVLLVIEECVCVMIVGTYGTIYGGNLLVLVVVGKVLELINILEMFNGVKQCYDWFVECFNIINYCYGLFSEVCGLGLLIGCVLNVDYVG